MIETIFIAIILAKIKGYKLKPLFKCWGIYPVFVFVLIYVMLNIGVFLGDYHFIKYASVLETLYFASFFILIFKYKQYISAIIGSSAVFIGTILNKIAISANGGKMPVFPTFSYITGYANPAMFTKVKDVHVLGDSSTKLKFLTDIFDIGYSILSIGDIFIRIFTFIIIYNTIKSINTINEN